jgi:hypothetical protein
MYQWHSRGMPCTAALRRALAAVHGPAIASDLLFLEAWEMDPTPDISAIFRVRQIRRANPGLAAEIRAKLAFGSARTTREPSGLHARSPALDHSGMAGGAARLGPRFWGIPQ